VIVIDARGESSDRLEQRVVDMIGSRRWTRSTSRRRTSGVTRLADGPEDPAHRRPIGGPSADRSMRRRARRFTVKTSPKSTPRHGI